MSTIFYDDRCNLCKGFVAFINKRDKNKVFAYVPLRKSKLPAKFKQLNTVILEEKKTYYIKSDAAIKIYTTLGFPWSIVKVFVIIPKIIRDKVYEFVARHRLRFN